MSNVTSSLPSLPSLDVLSSILSSPAFASVSASARTSWKAYAASLGLGYLLLCRVLRYRREKAMRRKYGFPDRQSLKGMTVEQAQLILKDLASLEFPLMMETSLQFALFKVGREIALLYVWMNNVSSPVCADVRRGVHQQTATGHQELDRSHSESEAVRSPKNLRANPLVIGVAH